MLSLQNITKIYSRKQSEEDIFALDDVSLDLPDKGFVAILGASGSGKTTLLNIIGGLDKATSGNMIVDGLSTSDFSESDWDSYRNHKIGFVLQNCYLLPHLNVRDNIAIKLQISHSDRKDIDQLVDEALEKVDLLDKKYDKPKALSGGQKQRVAIARALVGNPTVILADEPTGALDSKTGTSIMELLKKASKHHLVVMVTHNDDYASKYADRVIELKDGKIINDSNPFKIEGKIRKEKLSRVSIPPTTSVKWGFKNLIIKKLSSISVIVAAALGLAGVGLIVSISSGVQTAFEVAEEDAFKQFPVSIYCNSMTSSNATAEEYIKYTTEESVFVDYSGYAKQEHYNYMSSNFLNYMSNMPSDYYFMMKETSTMSFNIVTQVTETSYRYYNKTNSLFYKGLNETDVVEELYDILAGSKMPTEYNEMAIVVDDWNRLPVSTLNTLGFPVVTSESVPGAKFSFEDILSKTYRYISNDDMYVFSTERNRYERRSDYKQLYEDSTVEIKITAILRRKRNNNISLVSNGIFYTPAFEAMILEDANNSAIVQKQLLEGVNYDVLTGQPFVDSSGSFSISAEYQLEQRLLQLGHSEEITALNYFTKNYDNRVKIIDYYNLYDKTDETVWIGTRDQLEKTSADFDGALRLMTSVLYVFAIVSIIVSAILNAILTYISVHQRTNEIGLLRSLGATKKNVALMVETESMICGLFGGIFSILLTLILIKPAQAIITQAIYDFNFYLISKTQFDLGGFKWWAAPILIGIAVLVATVSALIPAIIASKKDPAKAINE